MSLSVLRSEITNCQSCPRLREWCAMQKGTNLKYKHEDYWAKPVPGNGDQNGGLLIVGLAPGAHGANRTGIPFIGDTAGTFLYQSLKKHGYLKNGRLIDVYITNAVKCAPPENKPNKEEFKNCQKYLIQEINNLPNLKAILALGEKAFYEVIKIYGYKKADYKFGHGVVIPSLSKNPIIIASYHTSKYNLHTKLMDEEKMDEIFLKIMEESDR